MDRYDGLRSLPFLNLAHLRGPVDQLLVRQEAALVATWISLESWASVGGQPAGFASSGCVEALDLRVVSLVLVPLILNIDVLHLEDI